MSYTIAKKIDVNIITDVCQVLFGAFFLGMFAKIYIPLFFTPIPIVLQNSIAISYGYFLGLKKGSLAILLFILLGVIGFPFFAGSNFGMQTILGIRGGYILSYFFASYFVGRIFDQNRYKSQKNIAVTILFGHLIVLFGGFLWFSYFVGLKKAFLLGMLPFIVSDIFKSIVMTKLIQIKNSYL